MFPRLCPRCYRFTLYPHIGLYPQKCRWCGYPYKPPPPEELPRIDFSKIPKWLHRTKENGSPSSSSKPHQATHNIITFTASPSLDRFYEIEKPFKFDDVNRTKQIRLDVGGKPLNAARAIQKLAKDRALAIVLLGGESGKKIEKRLAAEGLKTVVIRTRSPTRENLFFRDPTGKELRFQQRNPRVTDAELKEAVAQLERHLPKAKALILGGSLPLGCPKDLYRSIVELAKHYRVPCFLDADGDPLLHALKAEPYAIKINHHEAGRLINAEVEGPADAVRAALEIAERFGIDVVIVTLGEKGAVLFWKEKEQLLHFIPPKVGLIKSTIGTGDALLGVFVLKLADREPIPIKEALRWGVAASAAKVMYEGTEFAERDQVEKLKDKVIIEELLPVASSST